MKKLIAKFLERYPLQCGTMIRLRLCRFCVLGGAYLFVACVYAAPTFVTGRMIDRRNGLTDEQYEQLWSMGRNPQIKQTVARDWVFRASRYANVTNWLDICGKTNDFAALSYDLQGKNFELVETNKTLATACVSLASETARLYAITTNQIAHISSMSNLLTVVSAQADAANSKIQGEIADLEEKITKYEEYKTKYPLLKSVWTALITDAQNRIAILQALTN